MVPRNSIPGYLVYINSGHNERSDIDPKISQTGAINPIIAYKIVILHICCQLSLPVSGSGSRDRQTLLVV